MNFHGYEHLAKNALSMIGAHQPHERADAQKIYAHYCGDALPTQDFASAYVSLTFLLTDDFDAAETRLFRDTGLGLAACTQLLKNSVNHGILSSIKDEAYFYRKGLLRGEDTYYPASSQLKQGTAFDHACRDVPSKYRAILQSAIYHAHTKTKAGDDVTFSKRALPYVPVQLMPPGPNRDFRLNVLSQQKTPRDHQMLLSQSRYFILQIAERSSIIFGHGQLVGERIDVKQSAPEPSGRLAQKQTRNFGSRAVITFTPPPANENKMLMRELADIARTGNITKEEGRIYLWLHDLQVSEPRLHRDAARHFDKNERAIVSIDDKVRLALDAHRRDIPLKLLSVKR